MFPISTQNEPASQPSAKIEIKKRNKHTEISSETDRQTKRLLIFDNHILQKYRIKTTNFISLEEGQDILVHGGVVDVHRKKGLSKEVDVVSVRLSLWVDFATKFCTDDGKPGQVKKQEANKIDWLYTHIYMCF